MENADFDFIEAGNAFLINQSVWRSIWASHKEQLLPNRKNKFAAIFSLLIGLILALIVGRAENTVQITTKICEALLSSQLAIFGCIFAVYSILLAFLSDDYIKKLVQVVYNDGSNYLKVSTEYYGSTLFIYFIAILTSLLLEIVLYCIPEDFVLTKYNAVNESIACFLLFLYFTYSIRVIYELKSVVFNTLFLFRTSLSYKLKSFAKENTQEEVDKVGV